MADQGERIPLALNAAEQAAADDFHAWYGPWQPLSPAEVAAELDGFDRPWWVIGGWAIEAASGYRREHEDLDISILSSDVAAFVEHLSGRWHVWNDVGGVLRPLGGRRPGVEEPRGQLWLRRNATSPWVLDLSITPAVDGRWSNKLVVGHVADLDDVTWIDEAGLRYLRPEIVLLFKAARRRAKDEADLAATLPVLSPEGRAWLRSALTGIDLEHPWLARL